MTYEKIYFKYNLKLYDLVDILELQLDLSISENHDSGIIYINHKQYGYIFCNHSKKRIRIRNFNSRKFQKFDPLMKKIMSMFC